MHLSLAIQYTVLFGIPLLFAKYLTLWNDTESMSRSIINDTWYVTSRFYITKVQPANAYGLKFKPTVNSFVITLIYSYLKFTIKLSTYLAMDYYWNPHMEFRPPPIPNFMSLKKWSHKSSVFSVYGTEP